MIKLKKIVNHLAGPTFEAIEADLVKNKADNFLYLLRTYRSTTDDTSDDEILLALNISRNSLYVLKSRLNDKIQEHLSGNLLAGKEEVLRLLHEVPQICFDSSREVSEAILLKLEKDLLMLDMHDELQVVYSALKKVHLYSEKYFYYSQLYNKHVAFGLSIEKCTDILCTFNRQLAQYFFSRSGRQLETLNFLFREIGHHYSLNSSRQVELMKNIIELQLIIFCGQQDDSGQSTEEKLAQTAKLISDMPLSSPYKCWQPVSDFLYFEHYYKTGQFRSALPYYEKINQLLPTLLLYTPVCLTPRFILSRLGYILQRGETPEPLANDMLFDSGDKHSCVLIGVFNAMIALNKKNYREAANKLNAILNAESFKDLFHIAAELKLTLAFIYIYMRDFDMADNIMKNLVRKIKSDCNEQYANLLALVKVFNADLKKFDSAATGRQKDDFMIFLAKNTGSSEALVHLMPELKKRYT